MESNATASAAPEVAAETTASPIAATENAAATSQDAIAEAIRKYKVKVDGQEVEVDETELLSGYSKAKAADKKFQEAAMTRKQAEEFIHQLRTDPLKVLTNPKLGIEFRKVAEEYLVSQLEEEQMDPRDKELRDAKRQLREIEERNRKASEEAESSRVRELESHYAQDYTAKITKVLETSGLPRTQHTVKRMAYYMHAALTRGIAIEPADVVDLVRKDYVEEQKSLFGQLDGDMLVQLLGEDVAAKIRKHDLGKVKRPAAPPKSHSTTATPRNNSSRISVDEFRAKMERIKRGLE